MSVETSSAAAAAADAAASVLTQELELGDPDTYPTAAAREAAAKDALRGHQLGQLYDSQILADKRGDEAARADGLPAPGASVLASLVAGNSRRAQLVRRAACGPHDARTLARARARNAKREMQTRAKFKPEICDTRMPSEADIEAAAALLETEALVPVVRICGAAVRDLVPDWIVATGDGDDDGAAVAADASATVDDDDDDDDDVVSGGDDDDGAVAGDASPAVAAVRAVDRAQEAGLDVHGMSKATWGAALRAMKAKAAVDAGGASSDESGSADEGDAGDTEALQHAHDAGAGRADVVTPDASGSGSDTSASTPADSSWKKWRRFRDDGSSISESQPWKFGPICVHVCWIRYSTTQFARDIEVASFDAGKPSPLVALCRTPRSLGIDNLQWQRHNVFHEHPFFVAMLNPGRMPVISFDSLIEAVTAAIGSTTRTVTLRIVKAVRNFRANYMTHLPAIGANTMFPNVRGVSGIMRIFPAYMLPFLYIFAKEIDGRRDALIIAEARKAGQAVHDGAQLPVSATAISRFFQSLTDFLQSLELSCASKNPVVMRLRRLSWYQLNANIGSVQATLREQALVRERTLVEENTILRRSIGQLRRHTKAKDVASGCVKRRRT